MQEPNLTLLIMIEKFTVKMYYRTAWGKVIKSLSAKP